MQVKCLLGMQIHVFNALLNVPAASPNGIVFRWQFSPVAVQNSWRPPPNTRNSMLISLIFFNTQLASALV